jgi:hypothetical protein
MPDNLIRFTKAAAAIGLIVGLLGALNQNPAARFYDIAPILLYAGGIIAFMTYAANCLGQRQQFVRRLAIFAFCLVAMIIASVILVKKTGHLFAWGEGGVLFLFIPPILLFLGYVFPTLCLRPKLWQKAAFVILSFGWAWLTLMGCMFVVSALFEYIIRPAFPDFHRLRIAHSILHGSGIFLGNMSFGIYVLLWNKGQKATSLTKEKC